MSWYIDHMQHPEMARMRKKHSDWIWNRSDTHIFLAVPGSHEAFKTPVEPGNSFSPGPGTYGISTWVHTAGALHAPEEKPLEALSWRFDPGGAPILTCTWQAGSAEVSSRLYADGDPAWADFKDYLSVALRNAGDRPLDLRFFLVIRSFGPAGGPVRGLALGEGAVLVNDRPSIYFAEAPTAFGTVCYADTGHDIGAYLRQGELPPTQAVEDASGWGSGALEYCVRLAPGEVRQLAFAFHLHAGASNLPWLKPPSMRPDVAAQQADFADRWRVQFPVALDLPDRRFVEAFQHQLTHMFMSTVSGAPRTTPITYPLWWIRDGSAQVVAMDRGGLHDNAALACRLAARKDARTGFGAEADSPGELIWMISEHYLLTRSAEFLAEMYPTIKEKADLIVRMRHTEVPLFFYQEFMTHEHALRPDTQLMCAPARDGLIIGRMDHHFPLFFTNAFCYLGLARAAFCAAALGHAGDASLYAQEAAALREAMRAHAVDAFGHNERDTYGAIWPTGWASADDPLIRERYEAYWHEKWAPGGVESHEPLWQYFELGDAHNRMILGERDRAWVCIEHYLRHHTAPGLYTYPEGDRDENSALLLWEKTRGWDRAPTTTPAGWVAAELFLLLRDALAREDGDTLVLGSGVPAAWMDVPFGIERLPTHFGPLSFRYDPAQRSVRVALATPPPGGIRCEFPHAVKVMTSGG